MNNIYSIYKPKGPTSHDIIDQLRKITGIKKIGHAGTLDPLASGILVVGVGREGTKQLGKLVKSEKEYLATIKLGTTSTTDDEEGAKHVTYNTQHIAQEKIKKILKQFTGKIKQTPPIYSAIKINGKSAYKYARAGKEIKLKSRIVEIKSIEISSYQWPYLKIKVVCGSGVYIRSLARDIGEKLKTGAYLADLIRTRVGKFNLQNSYSLQDFNKYWKSLKK